MQQYQNTDVVARRWDTLIDLDTERTLFLEPGAVTTAGVGVWVHEVDDEGEPDKTKPMVRSDLPADFTDEYLKPVAAAKAKAKDTAGATTPAEAHAEADTPKE
jgi:hypothetical protein